jgi:hypothetical protein
MDAVATWRRREGRSECRQLSEDRTIRNAIFEVGTERHCGDAVACLPVLASLLAARAFRSFTPTQWLNSANQYAKKIPHRLGVGLKIPSLRWIREGQTLPAGDAEATIEV